MATIVERALEMIPPNCRIGLGSGRAALSFVRGLAEKYRGGFPIWGCVPTSVQTAAEAQKLGLPLASLEDVWSDIDVTFDGADEVDPNFNLIKGYGRALVREKIVAAASREVVILVGEEKKVEKLGQRGKLPIEVLPFALPFCKVRLEDLGLRPVVDIRDGKPFVTDNGNYIIDCMIEPIDDPYSLETKLRTIPGIVDTGLFLGVAGHILVGKGPDFALVGHGEVLR